MNEDAKKRILCPPALYERVSRAVADSGLGLYFDVIASPVIEGDQLVIAASEREMQDMLLAGLKESLPWSTAGGRGRAQPLDAEPETEQEPGT